MTRPSRHAGIGAALACVIFTALSVVVSSGLAHSIPAGAAAKTLTFTPVADTYVSAAVPISNNGTRSSLRVDGSPIVTTYIRFDVQGVPRGVTSATLRILANSNQNKGYEVYAVTNIAWGETTTTYANAPAI